MDSYHHRLAANRLLVFLVAVGMFGWGFAAGKQYCNIKTNQSYDRGYDHGQQDILERTKRVQ